MDYICLGCNTIIRNGDLCPRCGVRSTTPRVEEMDDDGPSPSAAAASSSRKRGPETRPLRLDAPSPSLTRWLRGSATDERYALLYTLGRCRLDTLGGDGAYVSWLHRFFEANRSVGGCVAVAGLLYEGSVGSASKAAAARQFRNACKGAFVTFCQRPELAHTNVIILNWHLRFTGTPNGWTGRGISPAAI